MTVLCYDLTMFTKAEVNRLKKQGIDISRVFKLENSEEVLYNVHSAEACRGPHCTLHKRSNHVMRSFPQHWRDDRGIMERICSHGVGHPDPDSPWPEKSVEWVHGCDGCCSEKGYQWFT